MKSQDAFFVLFWMKRTQQNVLLFKWITTYNIENIASATILRYFFSFGSFSRRGWEMSVKFYAYLGEMDKSCFGLTRNETNRSWIKNLVASDVI